MKKYINKCLFTAAIVAVLTLPVMGASTDDISSPLKLSVHEPAIYSPQVMELMHNSVHQSYPFQGSRLWFPYLYLLQFFGFSSAQCRQLCGKRLDAECRWNDISASKRNTGWLWVLYGKSRPTIRLHGFPKNVGKEYVWHKRYETGSGTKSI